MPTANTTITNGPGKFDLILHLLEPMLPGNSERTSEFKVYGLSQTLAISIIGISFDDSTSRTFSYNFTGRIKTASGYVEAKGQYDAHTRKGSLTVTSSSENGLIDQMRDSEEYPLL